MTRQTVLKKLRTVLMAVALTVFAFGTTPAYAHAVSCINGQPTVATYWLSKSGLKVNFQVEWNCYSWGTHIFSLDYGDTNMVFYTCWTNCSSGIFKTSHTYSAAGRYLTWPQGDVWNESEKAQWVTVP